MSPRTYGNGGGRYAVRGPAGGSVGGEVDAVLECPTDLALALVRTQLFDDSDIVEVAALQDQVVVLADGPAQPMPVGVPTVDVRAPLGGGFLRALDWMLQFMPTLPEDDGIREELSGLGVGVGLVDALLAEPAVDAEERQGLAEGMRDVQERCAAVRSSAELFGSREFYAGDHLRRAAGAFLGILGNAVEEYLGVGYRADENGEPFDGARSYAITFAPDGTPDVGAFWSITLYDDAGHLYANPLDRYVLGSRQLGGMVRDGDGSLTLRVQHARPPEEQVANWLPCPSGRFGLTFRTYLPGPALRDGSWTAPPVRVTASGRCVMTATDLATLIPVAIGFALSPAAIIQLILVLLSKRRVTNSIAFVVSLIALTSLAPSWVPWGRRPPATREAVAARSVRGSSPRSACCCS